MIRKNDNHSTGVLVITGDPLTDCLHGPAIRCLELARALQAAGFDCTLASPRITIDAGLPVREVKRTTAQLLDRFSVIIAAGNVQFPRSYHQSTARGLIIRDMAVPYYIESMTRTDATDPSEYFHTEVYGRYLRRRLIRELSEADVLLAGNERQRDLLNGMLIACGKPKPVIVVPNGMAPGLFGIGEEPLRRTAPAIKGVIPGISKTDTVILWWGCACDWFDLEPVFRAMEIITDPAVKLVMGCPHLPNGSSPSAEYLKWNSWASGKGLLNRKIFILDDWIPYADRGNYLADADIGIYCHRQCLESRYSMRTRFYDYLWAGLPMIISAGDSFEDLVQDHGLGRVIADPDPTAWAAAIKELSPTGKEYQRSRTGIASIRERFYSTQAIAALTAFLNADDCYCQPARIRTSFITYAGFLIDKMINGIRKDGLLTTVIKLGRYLCRLI